MTKKWNYSFERKKLQLWNLLSQKVADEWLPSCCKVYTAEVKILQIHHVDYIDNDNDIDIDIDIPVKLTREGASAL
jgi:hypothetical protein